MEVSAVSDAPKGDGEVSSRRLVTRLGCHPAVPGRLQTLNRRALTWWVHHVFTTAGSSLGIHLSASQCVSCVRTERNSWRTWLLEMRVGPSKIPSGVVLCDAVEEKARLRRPNQVFTSTSVSFAASRIREDCCVTSRFRKDSPSPAAFLR